METRTPSATPSTTTGPRRKRRNNNLDDTSVRYFLPKPGSSSAKPELGEEVASEGEALIQAFRTNQTFYTLTAWKAMPEVNGGGSPMIVKQAVPLKQVQS